MNFRTTVILFILLIAIAAVALFMNRGGEAPSAAPDASKLIQMTEADVNRVEIVAGDRAIVLDRHGDRWRLGAPVTAPADTFAVSRLLSSLLSLRSQGQVKLAGNEQTLGLDQPSAIVTISGKDKSAKLTVGVPTGTGGNVYVRLNDAAYADLVPASALTDLDKPAKDFRDTQVVDLRSPELRHIILTDAQGNVIELAKPAEDWRVLRPYDASADAGAASDVVFAITGMRAEDFVREDQSESAAYELDRPVLSVFASSQPPSTQPATTAAASATLRFGRFDDVLERSVFAAVGDSGPIVKVPASALRSLQKKPLEFRDRRLLDINPDRVTRIQISVQPPSTTQPAPAPIVIERVVRSPAAQPTTTPAGEAPVTAGATQPTTEPATAPAEPEPKWRLAEGGSVNEAQVDALLRELHPLRVTRYLESLPSVVTPTVVVVDIRTIDESHTIRLNEPGDDSSRQVTGLYNGLAFEVGRFVLDAARADFVNR